MQAISQELAAARDSEPLLIDFPELWRTYRFALRKCTLVERRFVLAVIESEGRQYEAAESIGLRKFMADRLLARSSVSKALRAMDAVLVNQLGVTSLKLLKEYTRLAFSDIRRVFDDKDGMLPPSQWDDETAAAVESVETQELWYGNGEERTQIGVTRKIRFHKKQKALDSLAKMMRLLVDRKEVSGPNGGPVETQDVSDAQLVRMLYHVLKGADPAHQKVISNQ